MKESMRFFDSSPFFCNQVTDQLLKPLELWSFIWKVGTITLLTS